MTQSALTTAQSWLTNADGILVTASNGFSISEQFNLFAHDDQLTTVLGDLVAEFHLTSFIDAFHHSYPTTTDYWRVIARIVDYYGYHYQPSKTMQLLKQVLAERPYFIWTSNTEHHFQLAGLTAVFENEGNFLTGRCQEHPAEHPHPDLTTTLHELATADRHDATELKQPTCAICGAPLELDLPGEAFNFASEQITALRKFIDRHPNLLVLELGMGPNNQLIKAPVMELIAAMPNYRYLSVNREQLNIPTTIANRSIGIQASIDDALTALLAKQPADLVTQGPSTNPDQQLPNLTPFFPHYQVNAVRSHSGQLPISLTIDRQNPAPFSALSTGRTIMYVIGAPAILHCFNAEDGYYQIKLGLNAANDEVHGAYLPGHTFVAMEVDPTSEVSFSQLSMEVAPRQTEVLIPDQTALKEQFPDQTTLIQRFAFQAN